MREGRMMAPLVGEKIRSFQIVAPAMSLSLLKFVWQASLVDEAMLPS
jgi:hypothetical protein